MVIVVYETWSSLERVGRGWASLHFFSVKNCRASNEDRKKNKEN